MQSRFNFIFIIFFIVGISIFTVHVRGETARSFYKLRVTKVKQARLKQDLWQKQLRFESLINPGAISAHSEREGEVLWK